MRKCTRAMKKGLYYIINDVSKLLQFFSVENYPYKAHLRDSLFYAAMLIKS